MVATVDWFLEAGRLLTEAEEVCNKKLFELCNVSEKKINLLSIPGTVRSPLTDMELELTYRRASREYEHACEQTFKIMAMIAKTKLYQPRVPLFTRLYWWWNS